MPEQSRHQRSEQRPDQPDLQLAGPRGGIDPDVDLGQPGERREWSRHRWTLPTIAVGGIVGALARHGLEVAWPASPGHLPLATLITNATGSLLLGLLMVHVVENEAGHPLLRPFVGVGVLGGFTTFSTYAAQSSDLLTSDHPATGIAYLVGTAALALASVAVGLFAGRRLTRARSRSADPGGSPARTPEDGER